MTGKTKSPKPPAHLRAASKRWWSAIASEYELEAQHLALLDQAAKCLDRIDAARAILDRDGVVVQDRFGCARQHPGVNIELQNKTIFARLVREIGLDATAAESRPPRVGGSKY